MFLTADIHLSLNAQRCLFDFRFRFAALQRHGLDDQRCIIGQCAIDIRPVGQIPVFDFCETGSPAGLLARFADDHKNRLAVEFDLVRREQRLVMLAG